MNTHAAHFDRLIIRAGALADGNGLLAAPGVILVETVRLRDERLSETGQKAQIPVRKPGHVDNLTAGECRIIAAGTPRSVGEIGSDIPAIHLPDSVVIPALVNVHAHLDLTHIGPQPEPVTGGFPAWAEMIRSNRATTDQAIAESVRQGADLAIRGGTAFIGDIAGGRSAVPIQTLRKTGLRGVSYTEVFGIGANQAKSAAALKVFAESVSCEDSSVRLGVQPHAPYSCGLELYAAAAEMGLPLSTHLAETIEEIEFTKTGQGPLADMLKRLGIWDHHIKGTGKHPVDHLESILRDHPCVAAHVNYVGDAQLQSMARWPISVGYCPRASSYFGHPQAGHPPHRYRRMIDMGINVALGTDSLVCLPQDQCDRLSVFDEMRFLYQRDGTDPLTLLRMATINGARALNVQEDLVTLQAGRCAGLVAAPFDRHDGRSPLASMLRIVG